MASTGTSAAAAAPPPERALLLTAAVFVLSIAVVVIAPPPYLIRTLGDATATKLLSAVASISALTEIAVAPVAGGLADTFGRKPVLLTTLSAVCAANTLAAATPTVATVAISKFVNSMSIGLFFLSSGAILADAYREDPAKLAKASGLLFAVVNGGLSVGIALSSLLPSGLRWCYGVSAIAAGASVLVARRTVGESIGGESRVPFQLRSLNPFSFTRLLTSGRQLRLLALMLVLTLQPVFMGDVLQLFAISEFGLSTKQVASLFTLVGATGVLANVGGGALIGRIGVRPFTALACGSSVLFWLGLTVSYKAALAMALVGVLGPARTLGASTALTTVGAKLGMPQGQLSGDRSNLIAILKVFGPAAYGWLYVRGKAIGRPALPFYFNALLTFGAMVLGVWALRPPGADDADGADGAD